MTVFYLELLGLVLAGLAAVPLVVIAGMLAGDAPPVWPPVPVRPRLAARDRFGLGRGHPSPAFWAQQQLLAAWYAPTVVLAPVVVIGRPPASARPLVRAA